MMDDSTYAATIAGCTKCDRTAFEVSSYLTREVPLMLGEPAQDGRWTHDHAAFLAGAYRIKCLNCGDEPFASDACPACHRSGALADVLAAPTRMAFPKQCSECRGTAMTLTAYAPARVRTGEGALPSPTPIARFREPGFQAIKLACEGCDWVAEAAGCALCGH
jgi:hypothetical protein